MNRRYLAPLSCIGEEVFRQSITEISPAGELIRVFPFTGETAGTIFYNGLLLFTAITFPPEDFMCSFRKERIHHLELSFPDIFFKNPLYAENRTVIGKKCLVWKLAPVDWEAGSPVPGAELIAV